MAQTATKPVPKGDESYRLHREIEAAKVLRETYKEALGEDAELIADSIEGETGLFDKMEALIASIGEDKAMVNGLKQYATVIADRKKRIENRIELKRAMLLTAMQIAELQKKEFVAGTISRSKAGLKVTVTEESEIPSSFFKQPAPVLDKATLNAAVKLREEAIEAAGKIDDAEARKLELERVNRVYPEIPGVVVNNGGETLTIRMA